MADEPDQCGKDRLPQLFDGGRNESSGNGRLVDVSSLLVNALERRALNQMDVSFEERVVGEETLHRSTFIVVLHRREQEAPDHFPALATVKRFRAARLQSGEGRFHDLLHGEGNGLLEVLEMDDDVRAHVFVPVVQSLRFHHHLPIASAELAQHSEGNVSYLVVGIAECPPESLHKLCSYGLDVLVEKVGLEIINAQLQCPQTLAYKGL